ncbi:KGK domain-containing protein [Thermoleptolyngbya sp. M55_K2018_002]|uniref:KGK domain-containing protein n=1 Tax=Thermoleptolyngbya sp. M55_K2018_002 TaxID=2747808 RepID=UPI0019E0CD63|nr:KGK domain-containing protein [Thermoleptolyngbya sp. M55_K2018_002]HIK39190.1 KGK domain-containing protein [Thermoleptolyngbya sp. M55_K2018_002]
MNQLPTPLSDDEVIYISVGRVLMSNPTFKVGEFLDALAQAVSEQQGEWSDECEDWFGDGARCEVLRFGNQGWQRGRIRIRLEFFPENQKLLQAERPRQERSSGPRERAGRPPRDEIYSRRDEVYEVYREDDY